MLGHRSTMEDFSPDLSLLSWKDVPEEKLYKNHSKHEEGVFRLTCVFIWPDFRTFFLKNPILSA